MIDDEVAFVFRCLSSFCLVFFIFLLFSSCKDLGITAFFQNDKEIFVVSLCSFLFSFFRCHIFLSFFFFFTLFLIILSLGCKSWEKNILFFLNIFSPKKKFSWKGKQHSFFFVLFCSSRFSFFPLFLFLLFVFLFLL